MKKCVMSLLAVMAVAGTAASAETLRWSSSGDALTFDPHSEVDASTRAINGIMYERLISRDVALNLIGGLATSWEPVEGENAWLLKLREGVKFHEGQDFTAEDVVFSINRTQAPTSAYIKLMSSIETVEVINDYEVKLVTKDPNPILPAQLTSIMIMDSDWSEENGVVEPQNFQTKEETYAVRHANGTGPFKLVSRAPDEQTIMARNEDWWGWGDHPGNIDTLEFRPIANAATRVASLLSGELDFVLDPPLQDIKRIDGAEGLEIQTVPEVRTIFFGMKQSPEPLKSSNVKDKNPFADVRVRLAVNHALDLKAIQRVVMDGNSFPTGMLTSPNVLGSTPELDAPYGFDPEKSKELMAEAGYADGFSVQLDCPNDRYLNDEKICQAAVSMLARIGIDVTLEATPKNIHFTKVNDKDTDFFLIGWGVPTLDSQYPMEYLLDVGGRANAAEYNNPEVNAKIAQISKEMDPETRLNLIHDVWEIARADAPYAPVHHQVISWAMVSDLDLPIAADNTPRFEFAVKNAN
ncbi:ABC transporter substrate-binding protein [Pacificibacter sp. AS14]|uniref:ABC transporter substrate-binding protein n=1 Tax=Pacificibacter sp. AS14 TaxID=3135785 RepID=UPI0031701C24